VSEPLAQPSPIHDEAHGARALDWCIAHLVRREMAQAVSDCDHAVLNEPANARALSTRGSVWLVAGDAKRALQDFEAALVLAPTSTHFYNRGLAHAKAGAAIAAIADDTEAIHLDPEFSVAFHNRGYEYEVQGNLSAALADYR
jgi:tetratricopeptide (TPR) repeat protein